MNDRLGTFLQQGQQAGARYMMIPPRSVPTGIAGSLLGKSAGSSLEFMDHREYQPGDDLRRIDWSAYARSDRLTVKLYRQEVTPHVDIVLDGSTSMALPESEKLRATVALSAMLATSSENAGFSHRVWLAGEGYVPVANSGGAPVTWEGLTFKNTGNPAEAFHRQPPRWASKGIRVLVSDLLFLGDPVQLLSHFARDASAVFVIQILANSDANPPEHGNVRLVDCETGQIQEIYVDANAQKRYRDSLARHQENWRRAAVQVGAVFSTMIAEQFCDGWDAEPLINAEMLRVC